MRQLVEEEIQLRKYGVLTKDVAAEQQEMFLMETHKKTLETIETSLASSEEIAQKMVTDFHLSLCSVFPIFVLFETNMLFFFGSSFFLLVPFFFLSFVIFLDSKIRYF